MSLLILKDILCGIQVSISSPSTMRDPEKSLSRFIVLLANNFD